mmetsp:Transcript_54133/g.118555  ORF Transcript_54133/g.118555 Transcript_54133/m.118555 type:complete len:85 (+) Transcript_54133:2-256(+)
MSLAQVFSSIVKVASGPAAAGPLEMARRGLAALLALLAASGCRAGTVPSADFYALRAKDIAGKEFSFGSLEGVNQVVITNVASQ